MIYQGETLSVRYLEHGIAELRFDAPGSVNKLDRATLLSLSEAIAALKQERELKGLILTSGKDAVPHRRPRPGRLLRDHTLHRFPSS